MSVKNEGQSPDFTDYTKFVAPNFRDGTKNLGRIDSAKQKALNVLGIISANVFRVVHAAWNRREWINNEEVLNRIKKNIETVDRIIDDDKLNDDFTDSERLIRVTDLAYRAL